MFVAALGSALNAQVTNPVDDGFNPNPNGIVDSIQVQPDGKILVAGYFTQIQPEGNASTGRGYIARLNHDGSVDATFAPATNGVVRQMYLQPNGQVLIAGDFTTVQPTGSSTAASRNHVARLNADGTLDATFNPNANGAVYALAYEPNGQVVIGGLFTTVQPTGSASAAARNYLARINADGSLDTTFNPNPNRGVLAVGVQPNGQIVVGGGFSTLQANGAATATTRNGVARLNYDGSLDTGFDPEANGSVETIAVLPSGQIIIGGEFTTLQPNGDPYTIQCDFVGRLNSDGSLDTSFIINPFSTVSTVVVQTDGKLIIGGSFTSLFPVNSTGATATSFVARINTDGSLDTSFAPNPNQAVSAVAVQSDGDVLLGGYFQSIQGVTRNFLARVAPDGSLDATLAPDARGGIAVAVTLSNGQQLVGGTFISMGGITQSFLARLNANGSLDTTFEPLLNGPVQTIAVQSNGQILVGGSFTQIDGIPRNYIARLNTDGSVDGPFNPNPDSFVDLIVVQSTGKMLVTGQFNILTPNGSTTSLTNSGFARINSDGTVDTTFNPEPGGVVYAIAPQANGELLVGGEFTTMGGVTRSYIARINADGSLDTSYDPEANNPVYAIAIQSNGQAVIGGAFTTVEPITGKTGTPTTVTNAYGTQVYPAAGTTATTPIYINHLARLNTDGTLDTTFNPDANSTVVSIALQSDGNFVVGGFFTSFVPNGGPTTYLRNYIARVETNGSIDTSYDPNANAQVSLVQLLSSGQVLIGGNFTTLQPDGSTTIVPATHLAIINSNGTASTALSGSLPGTAVGQVNTAVLQPNGQMLVGGTFSPLGGTPGYYLAGFNADGSATTYNANVNGGVNAIAVLPNGGDTPTTTNYAAWLEATGALRYSFSASSNGQVLAVAQQSNGQVLVGGTFTNFANVAGAQYLVRLNTNGTVDTTFNPGLSGQVNAIVVQPNGQIVIGGTFTTISGTLTINYLERLNANGTLDTTFNPEPNLYVSCLTLQPNGQIIVGGTFTQIEATTLVPAVPATATSVAVAAYYTGTARNYIARINADGSLDTTFNPDLNGAPSAMVLLASGQLLVGGNFSTVTENGGTSSVAQGSLILLGTDGSLVTAFDPDPNGTVTALAVQADGRILVSGAFTQFTPNQTGNSTTVTPVVTGSLARVNTDGSVDTTFYPDPNGAANAITVLANQQILVVGSFADFEPNATGTPIARSYIARINANGTVDGNFDPDLNAPASVSLLLADGSIFIGGSFTGVETGGAVLVGGGFSSVGGMPATNLARLNADSTPDGSFTSNADGAVAALTPQLNGDVLVGGNFANIGSQPRANLARLNADGSVDASFNPGANSGVDAIALQQNGMIVVGGSFTVVGGLPVTDVARLTSSGAADATFTPVVNGNVTTLVIQANGQIVIGGSFTSVDGQAVGRIARLNSNGTLDTTFNPNANGTVAALTLQTDGSIIAAGSFTTIGGQSIPYAARILSSGAIDTTFEPDPNGPVNAVMVQPDGKIFLGGSFTTVGGLSRYEFARLSTPTPVLQTLTSTSDESTITWIRTGGAPTFSAVKFEESTDGTHWTTVGQGTAVNQTEWQLTGLPSTGSATFLIRATGTIPSAEFSSSGLVEVVTTVTTANIPAITSPAQTTGSSGSPFSFTVSATLAPTFFSASGLPPGLSLNTSTGVISGTPTGSGTYYVSLTAGNASGSSSSSLVITINPLASTSFTPSAASVTDRMIALSSRDSLNGSSTLIAGFVISGSGSKTVLLRAVGPGLSAFNLTNLMATPELQLYLGNTLIMQNSGWGSSSTLSSTFAQVGAFALTPNSADAAIVTSLPPGAYTIHVFDPSGKGGLVLTEIYDADPSPGTSPARLVDISARGTVSPGSGALIGGFVVSGTSTKSVIIRGVGPGLAGFGVTGWLADPVLSVFDVNGNLVAQNLAWGNQVVAGPYQDTVGPANIITLDALVGAFSLSLGDTAVVADLPPGAYTFQITSASNSQGEALGEIYELP